MFKFFSVQKSHMRARIPLVFLLLIIISCVPVFASDVSSQANRTALITSTEFSAMKAAMDARGIGGDIHVEFLYDCNDEPSFLLGTSDKGYQILSRYTLKCIEGGEANPYRAHNEKKKYYGGVLCYYVDDSTGYYNIITNKTVNSFMESDYLQIAVMDTVQRDAEIAPDDGSPDSSATITTTKIIPNADNRIRHRAFGVNKTGTCSAVACTLVLKYLDYHNGKIVSTDHILERLRVHDTVPSYGYPPENCYTQAEKFHQFLVNSCGMTLGSFGQGIVDAIDRYRNSSTQRQESEIACEYRVNINTTFGIDELDADRPTMLTSTIAGDYSFHTMAVYGYRRYSDDSLEWLVHTGWYSSLQYVNGSWVMPHIWVGAPTATILYRFTYDGM